MLKLQVIGNLGADAEVKTENGRQFVKLNIAHTIRRTREDGTSEEKTEWISATLNGDGGKLLPYLKRGVRVYAAGDCGVRMFHSEKQRALVAGLNLYVRDIELVSTNTEAVPRDLYDTDGIAHRVNKFYNVADARSCALFDRHNVQYDIDENGWVSIPQAANNEPSEDDAHEAAGA